MAISHDWYAYDQDYEADAPTGRCPGPVAHGCGRFTGGSWYCARCEAELLAQIGQYGTAASEARVWPAGVADDDGAEDDEQPF